MRAIGPTDISERPLPKFLPLTPLPLTTMVLNVTNQCNLALHLLLRVRRGQDRRHDQRRAAEVHVDRDGEAERRVHAEGVGRQQGGPSHLLRRRNADELPGAEGDDRLRAQARRRGGQGSGLQPDHQRDAAQAGGHRRSWSRTRSGVTISFDGPPEVQNKFRVFHNGTGSYDIVAPKIKELLQQRPHASRRRACDAHGRQPRRPEDLPAPDRGIRLPRSRVRAGDHGARSRLRARRAGLRPHAGAVHVARRGLQGRRNRRTPPRLLEREGDASRKSTRA